MNLKHLKLIIVCVLGILILLLAKGLVDAISNDRNAAALNDRLNSMSTYMQRHLGSNFIIDDHKREFTCKTQATYGGFIQTGTYRSCTAERAGSTVLNDDDQERKQVYEAYRSIYNDLITDGWTQNRSFPRNITPNNAPAAYEVDLIYRDNEVSCRAELKNNSNGYEGARTVAGSFKISMDCEFGVPVWWNRIGY